MLPFLKHSQEASASALVESEKREPDSGEEMDSLEVAMKELFSAKSDKERAQAFRAAFELLETEPHEEAEHE